MAAPLRPQGCTAGSRFSFVLWGPYIKKIASIFEWEISHKNTYCCHLLAVTWN